MFTFISNHRSLFHNNQYALSRLDICEDVRDICLLLTPILIQSSLTNAAVSDHGSDKQGQPRGCLVGGAAVRVANA